MMPSWFGKAKSSMVENRAMYAFEAPGVHEKQLRKFFNTLSFPEDTTPWPGAVGIVIFVNRSGSSLVSEHLRATGRFSGFGEPLNYKIVQMRSQKFGIKSFPDYFQWLRKNEYRNGTMFGFKASCDQVMMLLRSGAIPLLFRNIRWVEVRREDVLSQAVSLSIAHQTKQWKSSQQTAQQEAQYDYIDIKQRIRQIANSYGAMTALESLLDIAPYRITYEKFARQPLSGISSLAEFLGVKNVAVDTAKLQMKRQRNTISAEFRERFLAEFVDSQSIQLPNA